MITSLRGRITGPGTDHVILEVNDVGYKLFVPRQPEEDLVSLHVHHVVREDGQFLYGFASREELSLFEMLIGVSGVGPKAALAILSTSRPADVAAAIASGDAAAIARAPGVGKKTAERLIVDLRGRVAGIAASPHAGGPPPGDEVAAALQTLGVQRSRGRRRRAGRAASRRCRDGGAARRGAPWRRTGESRLALAVLPRDVIDRRGGSVG